MLDRLRGRWTEVLGILFALVLLGCLVLAFWSVDKDVPADEPARVSTTYYAEPSGRQCSRTLAQTRTSVAVAVSCSYPPAESRIADLLEGAGQ